MSNSAFNPEGNVTKIPDDTSKKLNDLIVEYERHLDTKVINVKQNDPEMGEIVIKKDDELRQIKRAAITALNGARAGSMERFSEVYGRYQTTLEKVADWNPVTGLGANYTHGEKLINAIKKLLPDIENNPGFIVGKLKSVVISFLEVRKQPTERNDNQLLRDPKVSEEEKQLYDACRDILGNLYTNTKSYEDRMQIFEKNKDKFFELINKADPKDKGFFSKVTSAVRSTPETQLKNDIKTISNKYEDLMKKYQPEVKG